MKADVLVNSGSTTSISLLPQKALIVSCIFLTEMGICANVIGEKYLGVQSSTQR